jgi:altronate hydrolase
MPPEATPSGPSKALRIHPSDNAVVALQDLKAGEGIEFGGEHFQLLDDIPRKHKFAALDLAQGQLLTMYGVTVGRASQPIGRGELITTGNVCHSAEPPVVRDPSYEWTPPGLARWAAATFDGYHRANGSVGTANIWLVVPLVFCENRNLQLMKEALLRPLGLSHGSPYEQFAEQLATAHQQGRDLGDVAGIDDAHAPPTRERLFPHVDGIKFLSHEMGCGGTDRDGETLSGLLAGYITHPNVAGATVLSLGCQKTQIEHLQREIDKRDPNFAKPLHFFEQQKCRSEKQMMSDAIRATFEGVAAANGLRREAAPLAKLIVGMECGGSDGFSGISANPVIGSVSDRIVALGGSVILSEFPELCGVEQHLIDRCVGRGLGQRFLDLMLAYQRAARNTGSDLNQNPSPGNIADGLITGAMKSAGAARKGGSSPVSDVLDYPEVVTKAGLSLLCTPGNDIESTTAMAGAHANLMLFSTGLGTPTGNAVAPVIKISSNSTIARKLPDMIDFDTGGIIRGESSIDALADELIELVVETASGRYQTRAQRLNQDDFIPWKRGISL